jgi:hypothetical protein
MPKPKSRKKKSPKRVLALPDLESIQQREDAQLIGIDTDPLAAMIARTKRQPRSSVCAPASSPGCTCISFWRRGCDRTSHSDPAAPTPAA